MTNFANGDVIGHTSSREAKLTCAEVVSARLGQLVEAALATDYVVLITADHGNLEEMINADGTPHVAHTTNRVAFIVIDPRAPAPLHVTDGKLADIAPTALAALGVVQPADMTGASLAPDTSGAGRAACC